ncbi:MAG: GNAT family N-acetyltransferase [Methylacidiphilales bacterium]|nr:GNAT family N-acetyltransferase [Candidatus Methylacidiphilales bacterium]
MKALPRIVKLHGGQYLLRALGPPDMEQLRTFFYSHTPETIHLRYGYMIKDMTPERAALLVGVDQTRDFALGIFEDSPKGQILDAVGRYCLDDTGASAEMAFVVRESKRGLGMASLLLQTLVDAAQSRHLMEAWASVAPDNHTMLHLLHKAGFKTGKPSSDGNLVWRLGLSKKPAR